VKQRSFTSHNRVLHINPAAARSSPGRRHRVAGPRGYRSGGRGPHGPRLFQLSGSRHAL